MSKPKDPLSDDASKPAEPSRVPTAVGEQGGDRRSGRVAYDSRGNPTWEWQLETGVYTRDVNTQKLKKIDLGDLSLADTAIHKKPDIVEPKTQPPGTGFNPYDKGASGGGFNPYDNARSAGNRAGDKNSSSKPARSLDDMRKLDQWVKLTKDLKDQKDE